MTAEEFIEWYEEQPARSRFELLDGEIHEIQPDPAAEAAIHGRIAALLRRQIVERVLPAHSVVDGVPVFVDDETVFEPDAFIRFTTDGAPETRLVTDPTIVVEIDSPATKPIGLEIKVAKYFDNQRITHVFVVDPLARAITHHKREHGGDVSSSRHDSGMVEMPFARVDLALDEVFAAQRAP